MPEGIKSFAEVASNLTSDEIRMIIDARRRVSLNLLGNSIPNWQWGITCLEIAYTIDAYFDLDNLGFETSSLSEYTAGRLAKGEVTIRRRKEGEGDKWEFYSQPITLPKWYQKG